MRGGPFQKRRRILERNYGDTEEDGYHLNDGYFNHNVDKECILIRWSGERKRLNKRRR